MDMKFDVEYWEHRRLIAVADAGDMRAALLGYVEDATEFTDATTLWGVRAAIADLDEGRVPSDLDVVAIAFRNDGFEAPKGTEPNGYDSPSDYVVSAHKADQPEPANPRAEVANAVAAAYDAAAGILREAAASATTALGFLRTYISREAGAK
jgi:hypothetical protein